MKCTFDLNLSSFKLLAQQPTDFNSVTERCYYAFCHDLTKMVLSKD